MPGSAFLKLKCIHGSRLPVAVICGICVAMCTCWFVVILCLSRYHRLHGHGHNRSRRRVDVVSHGVTLLGDVLIQISCDVGLVAIVRALGHPGAKLRYDHPLEDRKKMRGRTPGRILVLSY